MLKPQKRGNLSLSKLQSPITTQWLYNNYEFKDGTTLPRSCLYEHYLDFCTKNSIVPVNAASFGKIIRITFPDLKTRRLGTRGKSKYHYYGIAVKLSSPYYDVVQQDLEAVKLDCTPPVSPTQKNIERPSRLSPPPTKTRVSSEAQSKINRDNNNNCKNNDNLQSHVTLLPEFPPIESFRIKEAFMQDKVNTFLIMYRAHCQRILDTIFRANFTEVEKFLIHFWQGMPSHVIMILSHEAVIELIGICDNILYKAIASVLIPTSLQPLPTSLTQAIQQFAKNMTLWLETALCKLPEELQNKKLLVAKSFCQLLIRQTSLAHLAQAARTVVHQAETSVQMLEDLKEINFESILNQVAWLSPENITRDTKLVQKFFDDFTLLLDKQSSIEDYTEWISTLINKCVVKPSENLDGNFQSIAQEFLLKWTFVTSKIIQDLTLKSAKSFGSFHLLQMLFDDYIAYLIESYAEISEEICDAPQVERESSFKSKDFVTNQYCTNSTRTRNSSSSSSGRGSLSPQENLNEPSIFTFPNGIMIYNRPSNYNRPLLNPQQQYGFPYDVQTDYEPRQKYSPGTFDDRSTQASSTFIQNVKQPYRTTDGYSQSNHNVNSYNQPNNIVHNFNQSNLTLHDNFDELNQSDYYSNDLELVRQLQERTRSLMEATRSDCSPTEHLSAYEHDSHGYHVDFNCSNNSDAYGRISL